MEQTACSERQLVQAGREPVLRDFGGLLTALRMLVGWPCLPSRTPKAFTGLVLSSIEGEKTSAYSLPHRPAAGGGSPACAQGVSDLRGPEPANQVLNSKRPGSRPSNQKNSPLLLQSS